MAAQFLSTSPARGTTLAAVDVVHQVVISIHVPREGDDYHVLRPLHPLRISIHVPREGDDPSKVPARA